METAKALNNQLAENEVRSIKLGPNRIKFLIDGEKTSGAFSMVEYEVAPAFHAPPALHFHTREIATLYVLEGSIGVQCGEETSIIEAGSTCQFTKEMPFKWWNAQDKPARMLAVYSPSGFEKYFVELSEAVKTDSSEPINMQELMPVIAPLWEKYGIGVVRKE